MISAMYMIFICMLGIAVMLVSPVLLVIVGYYLAIAVIFVVVFVCWVICFIMILPIRIISFIVDLFT